MIKHDKVKPGEYNYDKWLAVINYVGVTDPEKVDWLANYLYYLENNSNMIMQDAFHMAIKDSIKLPVCEHKNTHIEFMGGSEYTTYCDDCKKVLDE